MKKILIALLLIIILPVLAWSAGSSFVVTTDKEYRSGMRELTLTFVGDDATGAIPDLTLTASTWTDGTNSGTHSSLLGYWGDEVQIDGNHAGIEPTENSELYIYQGGQDLLDGNGVDMVDNTAERTVYFQADGLPKRRPFNGSWTIRVTQQAAATASATGTIKIILTK